jgi:putative transposase
MTFLTPSVTGEIYHVFTRSISKFSVFRSKKDYERIVQLLKYYLYAGARLSYSRFLNSAVDKSVVPYERVQILAYCIMSTHIHLIIKQLNDDGIRFYMSTVLNSYTKYFNGKYNRKGPLWEGRFRRVLVTSDEQLLCLTRYVHLNPVAAGLVERAEHWEHSSYSEYLVKREDGICKTDGVLEMRPDKYRSFMNDNLDYIKKWNVIREVSIDND